MVPREVDKRKTLKNRGFRKIILLGFLVALMVFGVFFCIDYFTQKPVATEEDEDISVTEESSATEDFAPEKIDFQTTIDDWVAKVNGNKSILIYDLDRSEIAGEYNIHEDYNTASLYKLFVVYEGYLRVQSGEWDRNEPAGSTGYTILECLDLSIRESYSPCAETLWTKIGHQELDEIIISKFGIMDSNISNLTSNANDIMKMMQIFYNHEGIIDEDLVAQMKDSFLNQPETTYDWRRGLPSGFARAKVYDKVGWEYNPSGYWNIYHDAAIVEFPEENRHFIVVVMTNKIDFTQIRELGAAIEKYYYN